MSQIDHTITDIHLLGNQYRSSKLAPLGLKFNHAGYLLEICRDPGLSQDTLAQRLCVSKSNVARQVASLEEDGFLSRKSAPGDKRVLQVYPTDKTLEILEQITDIVHNWGLLLVRNFTQEEAQTLTKLLGRMKDNASAWMEVI